MRTAHGARHRVKVQTRPWPTLRALACCMPASTQIETLPPLPRHLAVAALMPRLQMGEQPFENIRRKSGRDVINVNKDKALPPCASRIAASVIPPSEPVVRAIRQHAGVLLVR